MDIDIRHDARDDGGRYRLLVDGADAGELDYDLVEGRRVYTHTGVRDGHEGQGLAGKLARRVLDDARADGVQIVAACPYVASYLDKHPDDADLVDRELSARLGVAAARPEEHRHGAGHVHPPGENPEHRRDHERLERLREAAIAAEYATGRHEETEEEAKRHILLRLGTIVVGFVVLIGGLIMMALPGPGIVTVIAGLAILSRELPWAERVLEYAKEKAKVDELKEQPVWVKGVAWAFTILAIGASLWWMFVADPKPGLADIIPGGG